MGTESRSTAAAASSIDVGMSVRSLDEQQIATIRTVHGDYVELDVPQERDFWLSSHYISSVRDNIVRLNIVRTEVWEHRLKQPGIDASAAQATGDRVLDEAQALSQRERMERELAAQRARMGQQADSGVRDKPPSSDGEGGADDAERKVVASKEAEAARQEMERQRDERIGLRY
jgi:hypothetical protein